jgi:tetratricopeptide (TPR) repeat protein
MSQQQDKSESDQAADEQAGEKLVLNSPGEAKSAKDFALWGGVLLLALLTVYSPAIRGKFLWDDDRHVENNLALRTPEGLDTIWFSPGALSRVPGLFYPPQYYPLTHTTYWVEYQLSAKPNGELDPLVFHITNVVLHGIAAILLWFLLRKLEIPGSWLIAAIWALHPMQVESAAWISERKNVLAAVFFFAAVWAAIEAFGIGRGNFSEDEDEDPGAPRVFPWNLYLLSLGLFVCAMLSKTVACSMPAVTLLLIWWKRGRIEKRHWAAMVPFFVIGLALASFTAHLEKTNVGAHGPDWSFTPAQRILMAGRAIWFYARTIIAPWPLMFFYPKWNLDPRQIWQWMFPIGVIAVIATLFNLRNRIGRGPVVCALIFCGVLVPALGFVNVFPMRYSYVADHFQYLASPALIAGIVSLAARALGARQPAADVDVDAGQRPLPFAISAVVLVILSGLSFVRAEVFTGNIPLFRDTVNKNPQSSAARYNLGTALIADATRPGEHDANESAQLLDEAAKHFEDAIRLNPNHDEAYNNWGQALYLRGNIDGAMEKFRKALAINPKSWSSMSNLAQALMQKKQYPDAEKTLRQAIAITEKDPNVSRAAQSNLHRSLAAVLDELGRKDEALAEYADAVKLNPLNSAARVAYGKQLKARGKLTDAASQFATAFHNDPSNVDALINMAVMQTEVGNLRPAGEHLELALRINPNAPGLKEAMQAWSTRFQAATRSSTTRSTTARSTTRPATSRSSTGAATQPSH